MTPDFTSPTPPATPTAPEAAPAASTFAAGDLVTSTKAVPWGTSTSYGRVLAVDAADPARVIVEWIGEPSGPIYASDLEAFTPEV